MKLVHGRRAASATTAVLLAGLLTACTAVEPPRPEAGPPQPLPAGAGGATPPPPVVTAPPAVPRPPAAPKRARTLREVQQRLAELGYDPGPADGVAGAQTATALRAFQSARGLRPTGRMDSPTREALEK